MDAKVSTKTKTKTFQNLNKNCPYDYDNDKKQDTKSVLKRRHFYTSRMERFKFSFTAN